MSLWFPIMINNTQIGGVNIHRLDKFKEGRHIYKYAWEANITHTPDRPGPATAGYQCASGTLDHDYRDGAMVLIGKVMQEINP